MAQTLQQQDTRKSSSSDNKQNSFDRLGTQNLSRTPNKISSNQLTNSVSSSIKPLKVTLPQASSAGTDHSPPPAQFLISRYQPSKVFITKCREELESVLESIKVNYHNEIKELFTSELYADLFIQIGEEEFKKPLHRCIVASRAFKFYSAIKTFALVEEPVERDIIISEFQDKNQKLGDESKSVSDSLEKLDLVEEPKVESVEPPVLHCGLPKDLISSALLYNFVRRVYLDQDLTEEELKLNQSVIDWLKLNRPELIKTSVKHSPDHRESFRTVLPDFDGSISPSSSTKKSSTMSPDHRHILNPTGDDSEGNLDDETNSQANSVKDDSLMSSLLTRTETFELISRNNRDNSSPTNGASKNISTDSQPDNDNDEDTNAESPGAENTAAPFVPTTRTGLKPKKFSTPVGLRTSRDSSGSSSQKQTAASKSVQRDESAKAKTGNTAATRGSIPKQASSSTTNAPTAAKRSSLATNHSGSTENAQAPSKPPLASNKPKGPSLPNPTGKTKPTTITRAHLISLERSQSPGTNVIKGSGVNFIAANKRLVAQTEKKIIPPVADQSIYDYENEFTDSSSFAIKPLTIDNLVAHMDKFTLVSYSKLAEALSGIFVDGLLSDTIILIKEEEKEIKAHKCILAARSAYLAELISKQSLPLATAESVAETGKQQLKIDLTEFSYSAVYFSIMHIYSGVVKVPDDVDLEELTKLSHLLHVNTLRQVCMHNLRMNYCHFFHKPCNVCCLGVLKTLPLAWRYDYTELYASCLQWIGSHFASIFCLREFSELKPHDLIEECYSATMNQLTPENVIPKTIECQRLLKNLPRVKWTESVICLVGRQLEDFCHYVADNYEKILQSESFLNLSKNCWECEILEENLLAAMNHLKPDSGCKTLIQLHKLECSFESYGDDSHNVSDSFSNLVSKMRKYCERYLLKEAAAVVHCSSWRHMNPSLQKRIKDQAIISTEFDEPTKQLASKPKLQSMSRASNYQTSGSSSHHSSIDGTRSPSNRSTPDSRLKSPSSTYLPPPKSKTAAARHVKVLK